MAWNYHFIFKNPPVISYVNSWKILTKSYIDELRVLNKLLDPPQSIP